MAKVQKKAASKTATASATATAEKPGKVTKVTNGESTPATPAASINRGRTTGMRVMQYQDQLLADNVKAKLTDEQLLTKMRDEFPNAKGKIFTADMNTRVSILHAVRRLFNEGRHGSQTIQPPKGGVAEYNAKGEAVAETPRRRRGEPANLAKAS